MLCVLQAKGHCGSTGGGKIQLYTVEQLVTTVAGLMSSLCEHLENTSGFFQVSLVSIVVPLQQAHEE